MQIHELPTDSPTTAEDYLAIDDGTSTRKALFSGFEAGGNEVTFTSGDSASPSTWQTVSTMASGTLSTLMNGLSKMASNARYLYSVIGQTALGTTATTITGAIAEIVGKIGNTAMTTTATTLTGAIKEVKDSVSALSNVTSETLTFNNDTTNFSTPTNWICSVRKCGNTVQLTYSILMTLKDTSTTSHNITQMSSAYRPSETIIINKIGQGGQKYNIGISTSGYISLSNIQGASWSGWMRDSITWIV